MLKLISTGFLLLLLVKTVTAQISQLKTSKELLLAIEESKPDTNRIALQLKLGSYFLSKPGQFKKELDSAYNFINQAARLSHELGEVEWQYKTELLMGNYFAKVGDLERCKHYFMRVINNYHIAGKLGKQADCWALLGDLYENNGKYDHDTEQMVYYQRSRTLYIADQQALNATHMLVKIADIKINSFQYNPAEKDLLQALAEYKKLRYKKLQNTYERLAGIEYLKGNYYRAMTYATEGIKNAEASGDTEMAATLYEEIARYNYIVKNYNQALQWLNKAMVIDPRKFSYKCNVVSALLALDRLKEARVALEIATKEEYTIPAFYKAMLYKVTGLYYNKINKNELALKYYHKILDPDFRKDLGENNFNYWAIICDNEISGIYLKLNQAAKAKKYLDDAETIFKNSDKPDLRYLADFYSHSYKYNLATGNYLSAVKNLEKRDKLQDSLFTINKDNKFAELVIQYETAQKEQSIKDLHNQAAVQQARLQNANLQRNITIGGVVIMIAISALFYKYYKQKKSVNDIITHKNQLLQHLLTEKEWLLKEVHHRVKNNLHTVICLLESQARYLENDALEAIETSQHRIFAMSLIHQKLYQSEDIKTINMATYIPELVKSLEDGFGVSDNIRFKLNIQPISLSLSHAIPLGLIINEAVTNSIKYAFPDKKNGVITINMADDGNETILELADDGIGMPQIDHDEEPESLGLRLIKGLSEDIDAETSFELANGTRIIIIFKHDPLNNPEIILESFKTEEIQEI
ncbi:tetratricopeptide repeat-containing sensor histidine kinase [Mucilaginibacter lappiensis]|uniref:tetratricopeptide repeat-containing sensor histidine kinase n=1 Tax=Mucilaginibacter lappiensis TaxID=354630 RepID=UPI003D22B9C8